MIAAMPPEVTDAEDAAAPARDEGVRTAFALGWQMAELYRRGDTQAAAAEPRVDLPEVGSMAGPDRRNLRFAQVDAALARLQQAITDAGLSVPTTEAVRGAAEGGGEEARRTILALHVELLRILTAADFRLGKAYGLGRALCDTCRVHSAKDVQRELGGDRVGNLYSWLLDLKTVLPSHAGESVYQSLREWEAWARRPEVEGQPLDWERDGGTVERVLFRQGEIWRALLSGEKHATDMLVARDYADAAGKLFMDGVALLKRLPWQLWLVIGGALGLAVAGLILASVIGNVSSVVAALGGLAAALGISWTGIRQTLGTAAASLRKPLWGAALDRAIVVAITRVDDLRGETPPPGGAHPPGGAEAPTQPTNVVGGSPGGGSRSPETEVR
jgi:hypothetical protein